MSQTEFGMIIMTALLAFCAGMAVWLSWPQVKSWLRKHHLFHHR